MSDARELAAYDGQRLLGHIVERSGRFVATTASGRKLGQFVTAKCAADALSDADQQRAAPEARAE